MSGEGITLIGLGMRIIVGGDVNQLSEVVLKDWLDIYARIFIFSSKRFIASISFINHPFTQNNTHKNTHNKVINLLSQ